MKKKNYEDPTVTKVEFNLADRVVAWGCDSAPASNDYEDTPSNSVFGS